MTHAWGQQVSHDWEVHHVWLKIKYYFKLLMTRFYDNIMLTCFRCQKVCPSASFTKWLIITYVCTKYQQTKINKCCLNTRTIAAGWSVSSTEQLRKYCTSESRYELNARYYWRNLQMNASKLFIHTQAAHKYRSLIHW